MRVLVTGAGGFLGRALCRALIERGDEAVGMVLHDDHSLGVPSGDRAGLVVATADMTKPTQLERLFETYAPEAVIHCAAVVGVAKSFQDPARVYRVNLEGSINLFEVMARFGVTRVLHLSSEEVYGAFRADRIDEEHPQSPLFAYGISKCAVEHIGRSYKITHGIDCINLRTSWVYGPDFPRDRVPCNLLEGAVRRKPVHAPCGADSRIDHTYIDDAVAGVLAALDCREHPYDAYHIASDTCPSLADVVEIIRGLVPGADISVGPGAYKHDGTIPMPRKGALDCSRAREVFGYSPRFDIRAGLTAYLAHIRATQPKETA